MTQYYLIKEHSDANHYYIYHPSKMSNQAYPLSEAIEKYILDHDTFEPDPTLEQWRTNNTDNIGTIFFIHRNACCYRSVKEISTLATTFTSDSRISETFTEKQKENAAGDGTVVLVLNTLAKLKNLSDTHPELFL